MKVTTEMKMLRALEEADTTIQNMLELLESDAEAGDQWAADLARQGHATLENVQEVISERQGTG